MSDQQAAYYSVNKQNQVTCELCFHHCKIGPGHSGFCRVRFNNDGRLTLPYYGRLSAIAVDPVEKKPLNHFYPGRSILSIGFFGCNLRCPFCQNYHISQHLQKTVQIPPIDVVQAAQDKETMGIAYTYSEPSIHFEYILKTAKSASEKGLKNVIVTNGQLASPAATDLYKAMDAANIDLKSNSSTFYKEELKGSLNAARENISIASEYCHVEVTTLVIPETNDSLKEIESISQFIAAIDPDIPLHLSCYYPAYHYRKEATTAHSVLELCKLAEKHLRYVYPGNIGLKQINTYCQKCGETLIERTGYHTRMSGIQDHSCRQCGAEIPFPV